MEEQLLLEADIEADAYASADEDLVPEVDQDAIPEAPQEEPTAVDDSLFAASSLDTDADVEPSAWEWTSSVDAGDGVFSADAEAAPSFDSSATDPAMTPGNGSH